MFNYKKCFFSFISEVSYFLSCFIFLNCVHFSKVSGKKNHIKHENEISEKFEIQKHLRELEAAD